MPRKLQVLCLVLLSAGVGCSPERAASSTPECARLVSGPPRTHPLAKACAYAANGFSTDADRELALAQAFYPYLEQPADFTRLRDASQPTTASRSIVDAFGSFCLELAAQPGMDAPTPPPTPVPGAAELQVVCSLARAGFGAAASTRLDAAIRAAGTVKAPTDLAWILEVSAQPASPFAEALALQRRTLAPEARAALSEARRAGAPLPDSLRSQEPFSITRELRELRQRSVPWLQQVDGFPGFAMDVVFFVSFLAVGWYLTKFFFRLAFGRFGFAQTLIHKVFHQTHVLIKPLLAGPTTPEAGAKMPDGADAPADVGIPAIGREVALLLQDCLLHLDLDAGGREMRTVEGPSEPLHLFPGITSTVPQATMIESVVETLRKVAPRQVRTLTGCLQPETSQGVGLTLSLAGGKRHSRWGDVPETVTLWEKKFDPFYGRTGPISPQQELSARYLRLAEPAAVWLYYSLLDRDPDAHEPPLGTESWSSYALFRAGVRWQEHGHNDRARALFLAAIDSDCCNLGAQLNLARLEGPDDEPERTRRLGYVKDKVERLAMKRGSHRRSWRTFPAAQAYRWDALWYRASLLRTLGTLNAHLDRQTAPAAAGGLALKDDLLRSAGECFELIWWIELTLADIAHGLARGPVVRQVRRVRWLLWPTLRYFGTGKRFAEREAEERSLEKLLQSQQAVWFYVFAATVHLAKECGATTADLYPDRDRLRTKRSPTIKPPGEDTLLGVLEAALRCWPSAPTLLKDTTEAQKRKCPEAELPYRARFNRACYLALVGQEDDDALADVRHAAGPMVEQLLTEPLLALRDRRKAEYDRIVALGRSRTSGRGRYWLAGEIPVVDEAAAGRLEKAGVTCTAELLRQTTTPELARALATASKVSEQTLKRWASVARMADELNTILPANLDANGKHVLDLALKRSGSEASLRAADPAEMAEILELAARDLKANGWLTGEGPKPKDLANWAANLSSRVAPAMDPHPPVGDGGGQAVTASNTESGMSKLA